MLASSAFQYLHTLPDVRLNIIDVGCHAGDFRKAAQAFLTKPVFWVGIDPLDKGISNLYNVYLKKAIADVDEEIYMAFYEHEYESCSSLLKMSANTTHNIAEYDSKWYAPFVFEPLRDVVHVPVCSLKSVIESIPEIASAPIHYISVDAQGMDIKVVDSLCELVNRVYFIQIETVISKNKEVVLYDGQTHSEYDIAHMKELGFEIYDRIDYTTSPEADILFYNSSLVK